MIERDAFPRLKRWLRSREVVCAEAAARYTLASWTTQADRSSQVSLFCALARNRKIQRVRVLPRSQSSRYLGSIPSRPSLKETRTELHAVLESVQGGFELLLFAAERQNPYKYPSGIIGGRALTIDECAKTMSDTRYRFDFFSMFHEIAHSIWYDIQPAKPQQFAGSSDTRYEHAEWWGIERICDYFAGLCTAPGWLIARSMPDFPASFPAYLRTKTMLDKIGWFATHERLLHRVCEVARCRKGRDWIVIRCCREVDTDLPSDGSDRDNTWRIVCGGSSLGAKWFTSANYCPPKKRLAAFLGGGLKLDGLEAAIEWLNTSNVEVAQANAFPVSMTVKGEVPSMLYLHLSPSRYGPDLLATLSLPFLDVTLSELARRFGLRIGDA